MYRVWRLVSRVSRGENANLSNQDSTNKRKVIVSHVRITRPSTANSQTHICGNHIYVYIWFPLIKALHPPTSRKPQLHKERNCMILSWDSAECGTHPKPHAPCVGILQPSQACILPLWAAATQDGHLSMFESARSVLSQYMIPSFSSATNFAACVNDMSAFGQII